MKTAKNPETVLLRNNFVQHTLYEVIRDELTDIKTSVSEAVTNAIVHAYKNQVGKIDLTIRLLDGNIVYIKIKDYGRNNFVQHTLYEVIRPKR